MHFQQDAKTTLDQMGNQIFQLAMIGPVVETKELNLSTDEFQVIELEVERPHPILSLGISYIFQYSSSFCQESFLSLGSIEPLESFDFFFLFFFLQILKRHKFDLCPKKLKSSIPFLVIWTHLKSYQRNMRIFMYLDRGHVTSNNRR